MGGGEGLPAATGVNIFFSRFGFLAFTKKKIADRRQRRRLVVGLQIVLLWMTQPFPTLL